MTPRRFKCSQFPKVTLDFNFECIKILQNDFCKQRYIIFNATISGEDRIYPKTHLCRTFLLSICVNAINMYVTFNLLFLEKQTFFENSLFMLPRQPIKLRESDKSLITVENYSINISVKIKFYYPL